MSYLAALPTITLWLVEVWNRLKQVNEGQVQNSVQHEGSPVEVGTFIPLFTRVLAPSKRWFLGISEPSTVFH